MKPKGPAAKAKRKARSDHRPIKWPGIVPAARPGSETTRHRASRGASLLRTQPSSRGWTVRRENCIVITINRAFQPVPEGTVFLLLFYFYHFTAQGFTAVNREPWREHLLTTTLRKPETKSTRKRPPRGQVFQKALDAKNDRL